LVGVDINYKLGSVLLLFLKAEISSTLQ
jgi:hypothetical protein